MNLVILLVICYLIGAVVSEVYFTVTFDECFTDRIICNNRFVKKTLDTLFYLVFGLLFAVLSWLGVGLVYVVRRVLY